MLCAFWQRGKLSGYVPFLQISNNKHKKDVKAISKESTVRIFYSKESRGARDLAVEKLEAVAVEMIETVKMAKKILESDKCNEEAFRDAYESMLLDMADPTIRILDNYAPERYGIEIPERLFWQVCCSPYQCPLPVCYSSSTEIHLFSFFRPMSSARILLGNLGVNTARGGRRSLLSRT